MPVIHMEIPRPMDDCIDLLIWNNAHTSRTMKTTGNTAGNEIAIGMIVVSACEFPSAMSIRRLYNG